MSLKTAEYTYDDNGNMKTDANKNIGSITYNHLNLPTSVGVDWNSVTYVYDATGVKLSKTVYSYPSTTTTQYAGNYIYENNTGQFLFEIATKQRKCLRFNDKDRKFFFKQKN